jgi:hypothetical protein
MFRIAMAIVLMIALTLPSVSSAKNVAGVEIPESLEQADTMLVLNGVGVFSKFFFDIYVSALYLKDRSQDAETILRDDMPMGLRIHIVSGWPSIENLKEAVSDGFKSSTGGNTQPIQTQIDRFLELMDQGISKGDYFDLIYLPEVGLKIFKNGTFVEDIKGLNFKRAFFGIWLGDNPVDDDLKHELLGL